MDVVSYVTGEPRNRVNQFARKLIDDGLLPKSIGKNIKKVGPGAAMLLIFALAHATRTADVTSTAKDFMSLSLRFSHGRRTPDAENKYDVDVCDLLEDIGVSSKQQLVEVLGRLFKPDDPWTLALFIIKGNGGRTSVELRFQYEEEESPDEIITLSLFFSRRVDHSAIARTYTLYESAVEALSVLMTAPDIPNDPGDFDDFLRANRGDFEDDQAMPATSADEMRAAHDTINPEGKSGEGDGDG